MDVPLYPLRFEPIFRPAPWGGHQLPTFLRRTVTTSEPIGEAWVLSDQDGAVSRVADGPLMGVCLRELIDGYGSRLLGTLTDRLPVLLKFLDARERLSVQVHPDDEQATRFHGPTARGKTEAWVILDCEPGSTLFAGLKPGIGFTELEQALHQQTIPRVLHELDAHPGDCVYLPAGTVHALGGGLLLFEIQQSSTLTYRMFDWGRPRELHVEQALASTNFQAGPCQPVVPIREPGGLARRERLIECDHFSMWRWRSRRPFVVGQRQTCRVLVALFGEAELRRGSDGVPLRPGDVILLPAEIGSMDCVPTTDSVMLLECGWPRSTESLREAA